MTRVLIYSQYGSMGGSTRLLLNLGRHLAAEADVFIALPEEIGGIDAELKKAYPMLHYVGQGLAELSSLNADIALFHLPFSVPEAIQLPIPRQIAVSMEIIDAHPAVVDADQLLHFEKMLYLHEEQVAHLPLALRDERCQLLPLINNIDFEQPFLKTKTVGSIGGPGKISFERLLGIAAELPLGYRLVNWSAAPHDPKQLGKRKYRKYRWLSMRGKLRLLPADTDLQSVMSQFDALVHTPVHGNGTSTVVSDALQCGKLVFLSDIPANVRAYSGQAGVVILRKDIAHYSSVLKSYDIDAWRHIRQTYADIYSREDSLTQWRNVMLAN